MEKIHSKVVAADLITRQVLSKKDVLKVNSSTLSVDKQLAASAELSMQTFVFHTLYHLHNLSTAFCISCNFWNIKHLAVVEMGYIQGMCNCC